MILSSIKEFLRLESASGILLVAATILAMLAANTAFQPYYQDFLDIPIAFHFGAFAIDKSMLLFINDGLMALFFLLVGLELKREVLQGELSNPSKVALPIIAAVGGMAVPALVYTSINWGDAEAMRGWAIPTATDIAFALGILSLLGSRVPQSLKVFLLTLAIADDLGAIIIIAVFYTSDLSTTSFMIAGGALAVLFAMNRRGIMETTPYILVGFILWASVLKSGVHATLAGVMLAFFIPLRKEGTSPLERLEHDLHPSVAYVILPLFAFANTGVNLSGFTFGALLSPVPLGIALGLFIGKQIGVLGFAWLAVKTGIGRMPTGVNWIGIYGISVLCGIGFTMSLFISSLAFSSIDLPVDERLGVLLGSLLSAILGYVVLRMYLKPTS